MGRRRFDPAPREEGFDGLIARAQVGEEAHLSLCRADSGTLHAIYAQASPARLPTARGSVPRLGIGTRMSGLCLPGIWASIRRRGYLANVIQNSCRELNLLANILDASPSRSLYYPGFGFVEGGHTGSTFEGLWLCGVAESLKHGCGAPYGADADHIMVKRGEGGIDVARRVVDAALGSPGRSLGASVPEGATRRELVSYYAEERSVGGIRLLLSEEELAGRAAPSPQGANVRSGLAGPRGARRAGRAWRRGLLDDVPLRGGHPLGAAALPRRVPRGRHVERGDHRLEERTRGRAPDGDAGLLAGALSLGLRG